MTRPSYLMHRAVCWFTKTHEVDWLHHRLTGHRRCEHCHQHMPQLVRDLYPDAGE